MAITKNWDIRGTDGHWNVSAKPAEPGATKTELTVSHSAPVSGPVTRDFRGDNDRSIKANKLVAEVFSSEEIRELARLLIDVADAVDGERT